MFTADGWSMKPSAEASLYLDGLELRKTSRHACFRPRSRSAMEKIKKQFCDYQRDEWKNSPKFPGFEESRPHLGQVAFTRRRPPDVNYADDTRRLLALRWTTSPA